MSARFGLYLRERHGILCALNIELADANGKVVSRTRGLEVPYRRGHLTTLRGNFLTNEMQGGINIDTGYDDEIDIDLDSF